MLLILTQLDTATDIEVSMVYPKKTGVLTSVRHSTSYAGVDACVLVKQSGSNSTLWTSRQRGHGYSWGQISPSSTFDSDRGLGSVHSNMAATRLSRYCDHAGDPTAAALFYLPTCWDISDTALVRTSNC